MGIDAGVAFVNTQTMTTADIVPAPNAGVCGFIQWRDIKTYQNYCYVVSECNGINEGLMVIDMSFLPDSVHLIGTFPVNGVTAVTSHNLSIDSLAGYLYAEGNNNPSTGIYVHSLANPANPSYVTSFGISSGIHDIYAYNDTVFVAEGNSGRFAIWDLSNKSVPSLIVRVAVPAAGYVHNIWPTGDHQHAVTTEETQSKTIKIWDISDLENISLVGQYLAPNGLAHNVQVIGDTVYISHYESGVAVLDISDPANPVELARYDCYPEGETPPAFDGTWGCYPFTSNGLIYGSNIDGRFWILNGGTVQLQDTLYPGVVTNAGSGEARVDFYAVNSQPLERVLITFKYAGALPEMFFDSCSIISTRTSEFEISEVIANDPTGKRIAWEIRTNNALDGPPLPPGEGVVLTAWFTVDPGNMGPYNQIEFIDNWINREPTFYTDCMDYRPVDRDYVEVCCTGIRGNVNADLADQVNILDLNYLVNRLFRNGLEPICPGESDVNNDQSSANVIDLTFLVNMIFRFGPLPPSCN
jgi:choice-of-anchor B domain-containing protein